MLPTLSHLLTFVYFKYFANFLRYFQIKREISIMKIVRHPNIVRLHEVCLIFANDILHRCGLFMLHD